MRRTASTAVKNSTRSPRPTANVIGHVDTSVKPCSKSRFLRYRLNDHLRGPSTSAVGRNHSPVSPSTVVVAGRRSGCMVIPCDIESVCVGGVVCCVCETVDVDRLVETVDCANAVPAVNTMAVKATVARLIIGDASIVC